MVRKRSLVRRIRADVIIAFGFIAAVMEVSLLFDVLAAWQGLSAAVLGVTGKGFDYARECGGYEHLTRQRPGGNMP
jgi:hypothetical protein